jgi:hypothetical protein
MCHQCRFWSDLFDVQTETEVLRGLKPGETRPTNQINKGEITMRFMMIVKHAEKQGPPPKPLMDAISRLAEEDAKTGTILGSGGLKPTALGARVRLSQGKVTVMDGPFTESKEIVGGYAQFELKSKEEAVQSAVRFMELHKQYWPEWEGETEVRQMYGPDESPC